MTISRQLFYTLGFFALSFFVLLIFPSITNAADMCGDVTGNGVVDGADLTIYKRTFDNLPPGMTRPDLCDVGGSVGCTEEDLEIMEKYFGGLATLSNQCLKPRISSILPAIAKAGDTITITGTGFNNATRIDVVGKNLTIIPASFTSTTLIFVVPSSMDVGSYVVRTIEKAGSEEDASYGVGFSIIASPNAPPVVDLKVADVDGPITIPSGTAETLSWTSTNSTSCTLSSVDSNGYTKSENTVLTGLQSTESLQISTTFTLTCQTNYGISANDSVTVNVGSSSGSAASPVIYSVSPLEARKGGVVTITGLNLGDGAYVEFVGQNLTAVTTASTPTSLSFVVPQAVQIGTNLIEVRKKASELRSGKTNLVIISSQDAIPQTSTPTQVITSTTDKLFTRNLWRGMRNDEIRKLQELLAQDPELYPEGITSGYYGQLTETAVRNFQCRYNIVCSGTPNSTGYGLVGPQTLAKLNEVYGVSGSRTTSQTTASGSSGLSQSQIDTVVNLLKAFGVDAATIERVRTAL